MSLYYVYTAMHDVKNMQTEYKLAETHATRPDPHRIGNQVQRQFEVWSAWPDDVHGYIWGKLSWSLDRNHELTWGWRAYNFDEVPNELKLMHTLVEN